MTSLSGWSRLSAKAGESGSRRYRVGPVERAGRPQSRGPCSPPMADDDRDVTVLQGGVGGSVVEDGEYFGFVEFLLTQCRFLLWAD